MTVDPRITVKLPMPDQVIAGRYRIISRLGSGGMGLVYLAEQLGVGNRVALKFLDPEPAADESRVARFLQEGKIGLSVQHPGAAQLLDLGRDELKRLFLCFELVEGEDLREVLKREGRLRFAEARTIALQVAQVLHFAHSRSIVHRDIKPENIRIRRDLAGPHVKVLDFGIARMLKDSGVRLTAEGMLAGTPRYMSPEQVKDDPLDGGVDQYSLALVFFEMLTGAVAMSGKNISQILMHQIQTLVPPLAWVDPQLANPEVDAFIARATAKLTKDRFPSMAEFILALQALPVDERAWPVPRFPPAGASQSNAPTRDGRPIEPTPVGLADTVVRLPERTQVEPRLDIATEPEGSTAVQRRELAATTLRVGDGVHPPAPAPSPQPLPPTVRMTVAEVQALAREEGLQAPLLELGTQPHRPPVERSAPPPAAQTSQRVVGLAVPPPPSRSRLPMVVLVVLLIILLAAVTWLLTHP